MSDTRTNLSENDDSKVNDAVDENKKVVSEDKEVKPEGSQDDEDEKLGDAGKRALIAERNRAKEAEKQVNELSKRLEEFEDSQRTDEEKRERATQKLNNENVELQEKLKKLERQILINEVVDEVGLPKSLAARLQGEDKETLVKDAEQLKELFAHEDGDKVRKPAPVRQIGNENGKKISNADLFAQLAAEALNK